MERRFFEKEGAIGDAVREFLVSGQLRKHEPVRVMP